jgi:hypothetical protein
MSKIRKSFEGYNFRVWLHENKEAVKNLVVATGVLIVALSDAIPSPTWRAFGAAMAGLVSKLMVDGIDYYFKEE